MSGGAPQNVAHSGPYIVADGSGGFTVYPTDDKSTKTVRHQVPGHKEEFDETFYSPDTKNIESALNKAEPGATVKLSSGTFYLSKCILIENFQGNFIGAGTGSTYLVAIGRPLAGEREFPYLTRKESPLGLRTPSVFWFTENASKEGNTHLRMADMTIKVEAESAESLIGIPWGHPARALDSIVTVTGRKPLWQVHDQEGTYQGLQPGQDKISTAHVFIYNVHFEGGNVSNPVHLWDNVSNVGAGISIYGGYDITSFAQGFEYGWFATKPINGIVNIKNCEFRNTRLSGVWIAGLVDQKFNSIVWQYDKGAVASNAQVENNTFIDTGLGLNRAAISFLDCVTEGRLVDNKFLNCRGGAIYLASGYTKTVNEQLWYPTGQSTFNISGNYMNFIPKTSGHIFDGMDGIMIVDFSGKLIGLNSLNVSITNNEFRFDDYPYGGIWGYGLTNLVVSGNRFSGKAGLPAIYLGIAGDTCNGGQLLGNDMSEFEPTFLRTKILLGRNAIGTTVSGGFGLTVFDEGGFNTLDGVTSTPVHIPIDVIEGLEHRLTNFAPAKHFDPEAF